MPDVFFVGGLDFHFPCIALPFHDRFAVELTYPAPEALSAGIIAYLNNIGCLILLGAKGWICAEGIMNVFMFAMVVLAGAGLAFVRATYKRLNAQEAGDPREAERERQQARAEAKLRASLPFLGDDIFVLIAAELDARMLGRLGCAAQRFWRPSVPDPAHTAEDAGAAELWSVAEEGARRRLCAQGEQVRGLSLIHI